MPKTPPKDYYASMMAPGTKKIAIVSKRLGSKERLVQIALCTNENIADKIVDALNTHQGMIGKLEVPAQKIADELRECLTRERGISRALQVQVSELKNDKYKLEGERDRANRERDAAQRRLAEITPVPPNEPVRAM